MSSKIERLQGDIVKAHKQVERTESTLQRELERRGIGARVDIANVPHEVAYWRGKWRLKCLTSKVNRERLQKARKK